jgi:hypothetical protein
MPKTIKLCATHVSWTGRVALALPLLEVMEGSVAGAAGTGVPPSVTSFSTAESRPAPLYRVEARADLMARRRLARLRDPSVAAADR